MNPRPLWIVLALMVFMLASSGLAAAAKDASEPTANPKSSASKTSKTSEGASKKTAESKGRRRVQGIAVAPFVSEDGVRPLDPDIATRLATSLAEQSHWIVSPKASGLPVAEEPAAGRIRKWADRIGVAAIVVGRSARDETVVDLRSGHSGSSLSQYPISTDQPEAKIDARVSEVAALVLADFKSSRPADELPSVTAASPTANGDSDSAFGLFTSDKPIRIDSEQLEVVSEGESRRLIFTDDVRVVQGEARLFASQLEAFYPPGSSQPQRLEASGDVKVFEGGREVRCMRATYFREDGVIRCVGDAILIQGCDEVRGTRIDFDLNRESVKVLGAASVVLRPDSETTADCATGGAAK